MKRCIVCGCRIYIGAVEFDGQYYHWGCWAKIEPEGEIWQIYDYEEDEGI